MSSKRIEIIENKIRTGTSLEDLQKEYPITKKLFLKLGGILPLKAIRINDDYIQIITGQDKKESFDSPIDKEAIIGTLLGDGNIYKVKSSPTYTFSFAHTWAQMGYVKLKYELLKPYINKVRLDFCKGFKDYSFHVYLKSLDYFNNLYHLFYTETKIKENPQKNVMKPEIINLITPRVFAFWFMDDGKCYGNGFQISIGKQPYYNFKVFEKFVDGISNKLNYDLKAAEEKNSYQIRVSSEAKSQIISQINPYIWPDFFYKIKTTPNQIGFSYREKNGLKIGKITNYK